MPDDWRSILREWRRKLRITQAELAERAGLSPETVRGYESRNGHPSRDSLELLIEALKIPNAVANQVRESAGYTQIRSVHEGLHEEHRYYTPQELESAVETVPWPEFVVNDAVEVVAANSAAAAIWHVDFARERRVRTRAQMNLLSVASDGHFGERVKNWEEVVGVLVSVFKANKSMLRPDVGAPQSLDAPTPFFAEILKEFTRGDPAFLARLIDVWNRAEPIQGKIRWTYPVVWVDPDAGEMRFLATVSLANEEHSTYFNDWIPTDAATWLALDRLTARS